MKDLVEKLRQAKEGSRDLDIGIWIARNPDADYRLDLLAKGRSRLLLQGVEIKPPAYTRSLDAAMTLIPDELQWGCNWDIEGVSGGICAYVWVDHPTNEPAFLRSPLCPTWQKAREHLPRLVTCAALMARQSRAEG